MTDPSDLPVLGTGKAVKVGTRFLFKPTERDGANVKPVELIALPAEKRGCRACVAFGVASRQAGTHISCHSLPLCGRIGAFAPPTPENLAKVVAHILEKGPDDD